MTSQEKLIRFIKEKADLLSEVLGVPPTLYFNWDDEECLRQLDDQQASSVWRTLELAIYVEGAYGLGMSVCPFCLASMYSVIRGLPSGPQIVDILATQTADSTADEVGKEAL